MAVTIYTHLRPIRSIRIPPLKNPRGWIFGENPKILVVVNDSQSHFEIKIDDNGKGIEEDLRDLIFEPKFTTKSSGMGLGLAMVKNIVETYKGSINFTSKPGKGTIFKVRFPK